VQWDFVTGETIPILGYELFADTGKKDTMRLVFNGIGLPNTNTFEYTSASNLGILLDSALFYKFKVRSINFNGVGEFSPVVAL